MVLKFFQVMMNHKNTFRLLFGSLEGSAMGVGNTGENGEVFQKI